MAAYPEVTVDELAARLADGAVLFDVREPDEYVAGHVAGAVLIPLGSVPARAGEFPTSGDVYVICKSGGRSGRACEFLRDQGVAAINIAGGTMGWMSSGREVVSGDQPS